MSSPQSLNSANSDDRSDSANSDDEKKGDVPECMCKDCSKTLDQIQDFHTHLSKMYAQMNYSNQAIKSQSLTLSKIFKELIPLLKGIDAKMKQTNALLTKMNQ